MITRIKSFRIWHFNHNNRKEFDISVWDAQKEKRARSRRVEVTADQAQEKNRAISKILGNPSVMITDGVTCLEWKQFIRNKKETIQ